MGMKNKILGMITSTLLAGQVIAVPVVGSSSQSVLDGLTASGPSSVEISNEDSQYSPDEVWSLTGSGLASARIIVELSSYADSNSFGIYDVFNSSNTIQLFSGTEKAGDIASLFSIGGSLLALTINSSSGTLVGMDTGKLSTQLFGFYLDTPDGIWYSEQELNSDGIDHMVAFQGNDIDHISVPGTTSPAVWTDNEFILAWEDLAGGGDSDFEDFVAIVESVIGVPEPSTLALFGISLLSLSLVRRKLSQTS